MATMTPASSLARYQNYSAALQKQYHKSVHAANILWQPRPGVDQMWSVGLKFQEYPCLRRSFTSPASWSHTCPGAHSMSSICTSCISCCIRRPSNFSMKGNKTNALPLNRGSMSEKHMWVWLSNKCLGKNWLGRNCHGLQVESLKDKRVTQVACGAWHTAAVAAPRPQGPNLVDNLPYIERLAVQHKLAAMYELTDEVQIHNSQ